MSTDFEWERWGVRDPYFGVLTNPMFRLAALTPEAKAEFFNSGRVQANYVLETCRQRIDPAFAPQSILDFGCGVGRLLMAFSENAGRVVGVDVSPSMLLEAQRNCDAHGLSNVTLATSDDALSEVDGSFELVHSSIVFQHIEVARGRRLFKLLVDKIQPGGVGALHVTFAWDVHDESFGQPAALAGGQPPESTGPLLQAKTHLRRLMEPLGLRRPPAAEPPPNDGDPEMQMNYYNLSELLFILQQAGVRQVHTDMTDHGGAMGAFLFFRRP